MKKFLIISNSNPTFLAGNVARDLGEVIEKSNHDYRLLFNDYIETSNNKWLPAKPKLRHKIDKSYFAPRRFRKVLRKLGLYKAKTHRKYSVLNNSAKKQYYSSKYLINKLNGFEPDYIIILFMFNFVNFLNIIDIQKYTQAKVVFFPMDMALLTGGCHFAWNCEKYTSDCANCPAFIKDNHLAKHNLEFKRDNLRKIDYDVFVASNSVYNQAKKSSLFSSDNIFKQLLPINENVFKPMDRQETRKLLNLPQYKRLILFGANDLSDERKGGRLILDSVNLLYDQLGKRQRDAISLVVVGNASEEYLAELKFETMYLGSIPFNDLGKAYNAADIFVVPSIEDSGPMMINQAILVGRPVVAFDIGVAKDLIVPGRTGIIAKEKSSSALTEGIMELLKLNLTDRKEMFRLCRSLGLEKTSFQSFSSFLNKYVD